MESTAIRTEFTDADLRRRVESYLASRHYTAFRSLDVDVHDGCVTVSGCLPSYYEKQVALNTCQRVAGVIQLVDGIAVDTL